MMTEKKWQARKMTGMALAMAIVCVSTMAIQIPIPLGYMHLGNCCILLISVFSDPVTGALSAGVGSAMADLLTGYPQWIIPTLLVKGLMGYTVSYIAKHKGKKANIRAVRTLLATAVGILIMITGYTAFGSLLYGSIIVSLAQIPGLTIEGILGMILFYVMAFAFERGKAFHTQQQ